MADRETGKINAHAALTELDFAEAERLRVEETADTTQAQALVDVLTFRVGEVWLGVLAGQVHELSEARAIARIPGAPPHIPGLVNLHGRALPLLDLCIFLNLSPREDDDDFSRIVIVRAAGMEVGLLCHQLKRIIRHPEASFDFLSGRSLGRYGRSEVVTEDGILSLLELEQLLEDAQLRD